MEIKNTKTQLFKIYLLVYMKDLGGIIVTKKIMLERNDSLFENQKFSNLSYSPAWVAYWCVIITLGSRSVDGEVRPWLSYGGAPLCALSRKQWCYTWWLVNQRRTSAYPITLPLTHGPLLGKSLSRSGWGEEQKASAHPTQNPARLLSSAGHCTTALLSQGFSLRN